LARFNTFSKVSLFGLAFFMSACGAAELSGVEGEISAIEVADVVALTPRIEAPAILPEAGQTHFGKRLEEISSLPPVKGGTALIGDSITEGWLLYSNIEAYPFNAPVANHGVSWDVTEGAVYRLPLVEPSEPDQIFIKIGTNDISLRVPLANMERHFDDLLSSLRDQEPQAELFVQSVLPRETEKLAYVSQVNVMQAKLAQKYAAVFIDLTGVFAAKDGALRNDLTYDGLHLNAAGYAVWGEALSPFIK
jgi:lysophospholipase L1-like esterase